jgi:hypothetical protein
VKPATYHGIDRPGTGVKIDTSRDYTGRNGRYENMTVGVQKRKPRFLSSGVFRPVDRN